VTFTFSVKVDGADIAGLVPSGEAEIVYGRQSVTEQPTPTSATVTLITKDAWDFTPDMGAMYPEFSLGDHSMRSGFTDTFEENYEGSKSRVTLGAPVVIGAHTPSGFTDTFEETYTSGADFTRFTGRIVAIDYEPDRIQLTCMSPVEELTRRIVVPQSWPEESDVARAERIDMAVTALGPSTGHMAPIADGQETTAFALLQSVAADNDALFYATRTGDVVYRTRGDSYANYALPPEVTLLDPLQMTAELGLIVNEVEVEWGAEGARDAYLATHPDSVTKFGPMDASFSTGLAREVDAIRYADTMIARYALPHWSMPSAVVDMYFADDAERGMAAEIDLGDRVTLPKLLPGSPLSSYSSEVLGITETLSVDHWLLTLHLSAADAPVTQKGTP
jgi:hypothetical protein